jgi:hypothetical protein
MIVEAMAVLLALTAPEPARSRLPGTVSGNVIVLTPEDEAHRRIRILVDSGGYDLIESDAATRLGLSRAEIELGGNKRETAAFPNWAAPSLAPATTRWLIARPGALHNGFALPIDATLGPSWMLDHTISVDYPHKTIESVSAPHAGTPVPLTVGVGRASIPSLPPTALATIDVTVADELVTLLLDTGATARVRDPVKRSMPDEEPVHQVCLIELPVLDRWRRAHPSWTYAESAFDVAGDKEGVASPAILVPELRIGNQLALPTWFVARRDASTFAAVSTQMRKSVVGDLGGDALRRWRVTFDLKSERLLIQ